ncbi:hypothetical protein G6F37_010118 [Rhizopus arrhizus]|nr:hypothetical protein G6F38_006610 [Rhizopus arrhizus]KAG1153698.1 hypothetical protein G6F37_010118 [Rhizopus arrhizus]
MTSFTDRSTSLKESTDAVMDRMGFVASIHPPFSVFPQGSRCMQLTQALSIDWSRKRMVEWDEAHLNRDAD